jgi:hypothetical protein
MTLLLTEIHNHDDPNRARIIFAADRRITRNGRYVGTRKKIFKIPGFQAGMGYFGLAEVGTGSSARPMSEWIERHLRMNTRVSTLADFSQTLASHLNSDVPQPHRREFLSGFHIAGFGDRGCVEFWCVRNVEDDMTTYTGTYSVGEHFQRRDRMKLRPGEAWTYRNGDLLPHVLLWGTLDQALTPLLNRPDFKPVKTPDEYAEWVRFKMEIIAYVYKKYSNLPVIGRPIDVFCISAGERR